MVANRPPALQPATDRRSAARRKLHLNLTGQTAEGAAEVTVLNLSATGVLVRTAHTLHTGERLRLDLPGGETAGAKVVWASGELYGCRFDKALAPATVAAARLKSTVDEQDAANEHPSPEETFGARLRRLRLGRGISLIGLARLMGVSKPAVWKWERDIVRPRPSAMQRLCEVLGASQGELLFGTGNSAAAPLHAITARAKAEVAQLLGLSPDAVTVTVTIRD